MKTRENCKKWVRGVALAVALSLAATAAPVLPSQAASKKVTVSVKSPKKGVKLSGSKLTIHKKGKVVLTVKSGKSNVTKKATVKSSNKKVLMFGGGGTVIPKKNGKTNLTVSYKGAKKKLSVTVAGHSWKAHKATKTVNIPGIKCVCGKVISFEKKYCEKCSNRSAICKKYGYCGCKEMEHTKNHILNDEPNNYQNIFVPQKVKYIDYYLCGCGEKKTAKEAK